MLNLISPHPTYPFASAKKVYVCICIYTQIIHTHIYIYIYTTLKMGTGTLLKSYIPKSPNSAPFDVCIDIYTAQNYPKLNLIPFLRLGNRTLQVILLAQAGHVRSAQRFTPRRLPETFGSLVPPDHKTTYHLRPLSSVNS